MLFKKNFEWLSLNYTHDLGHSNYFRYAGHSLINVEYLVTEFYVGISINPVSFIFSFITILLAVISFLADNNHENENTGLYYILVTSTFCLVVCFITQDLFWFYLGFESVTIPIYYLIHMYGSDIDKFKACDWYALFSFFSGAVLSLSVAVLASQYGTTNISLLTLKINAFDNIDTSLLHYCYLSLLTAFMIKLPVAPFYMWLPEAHAEAPTSGSILLSGSILKLGGYGIYKYMLPLFGNITYYNPLIYTIIYLSILHGGLSAMSTNHIKQIIAYSSIVHMNLGALGLFSNKSYGVIGGLYCMLSHSFISSGLFILAGVLYNRYQNYYIEKYSGLFESTSTISMFLALFVVSNISTPLTGNFIGEFLVFISLIKSNSYSLFIVFFYILITSAYSLLLLIKIVYGGVKVWNGKTKTMVIFKDMTVLEYNICLFLVIMIIILGVFPSLFLETMYN